MQHVHELRVYINSLSPGAALGCCLCITSSEAEEKGNAATSERTAEPLGRGGASCTGHISFPFYVLEQHLRLEKVTFYLSE